MFRSRSRKLDVTILAVITLGIGAAYALHMRQGRSAAIRPLALNTGEPVRNHKIESLQPEQESADDGTHLNERYVEPTPTTETEDSQLTTEQYLRNYYGEEWPTVRSALLSRGTNLSAPLNREALPPPWEDIVSEIQEKFALTAMEKLAYRRHFMKWPAWPDQGNKAIIEKYVSDKSRRELIYRNSDLAKIESVVMGHNIEIDLVVDRLLERIELVIQRRRDSDDYYRAPIVSVPGSKMGPEDSFLSKAFVHRGWGVGLRIGWSEDPELTVIYQEIQRLVAARDGEIEHYLEAL